MLSRKKRGKKPTTWKLLQPNLKLHFFVSSLGTVCRARQWPRCNFLWESQFDIIMFSWWKHPSKNCKQIIPNHRHPRIHLPFTCTRCAYKRMGHFCCSSCVVLHFSLLILWQDLLFFWWLNKKIWSSYRNRALTKTESHSQACGGKADPSHWVW